jgi:hypothetical protein
MTQDMHKYHSLLRTDLGRIHYSSKAGVYTMMYVKSDIQSTAVPASASNRGATPCLPTMPAYMNGPAKASGMHGWSERSTQLSISSS